MRALDDLARQSQAQLINTAPQSLLGALSQTPETPTVVVFIGQTESASPSAHIEAFRTIRLIRTRKGMASVPILFIAQGGDHRLKLQCMSAGVTEFLPAPVRLGELRRAIAAAFREGSHSGKDATPSGLREIELAEAQRRQLELEEEIQSVRLDLERQNEAREAIFELSRQELLEANRRLKEHYEAEILALKEKGRIEAMFGRYVSPEIVDRVLDVEKSRELDGVRRLLTVFFADIRGFTSFCETQKPEKVIFVLNEFFTEATDIIHEHGGWVDKYTGDNIMALFGAPLEFADHARSAVTAACLVQERFRTLRREWQSIFGIELGLGIGLATGDVVVGNIGSFQKISYTAIGDTVNVASRLEGLCRHGRILLDDACFRQLDPAWAAERGIRHSEAVAVKGKAEPVPIYFIDLALDELELLPPVRQLLEGLPRSSSDMDAKG